MAGIHLITAGDGILPAFYEKYGFTKENEVILMGLELCKYLSLQPQGLSLHTA